MMMDATTNQVSPAETPVGLQTAEVSNAQRQQRGSMMLFYGKLILDLAVLAFFLFAWQLPPDPILATLLVADLLFLIPYYWITQRGTDAPAWPTYVSFAITITFVTWHLYTSQNLFSYQVAWYFMFAPIAGLIIPRTQTVRVVAALSVAAYLSMMVAAMSGWVPASQPFPQPVWYISILQIVVVTLAIGGIALIAARYFTESEQQRDSLARLLDQSRRELIWGAVGKQMLSAHTLDEILTIIVQALNWEFNVESGSVLLREWDSDQLAFAKIMRGDAQHFSSLRIRVGQGIAGWVTQTGQSLIVPDVTQDPRWYAGVDRMTGFTTRSILCVPLIATGETIGALELLNKVDGPFTQDDLRLLEAIATQVAPTIQNKRLQEQMQRTQFSSSELFRQVAHAKQEWENTVDAIDEGIALVDENCCILRANRALANWANTTPAQLIGRRCFEIFHGNAAPSSTCPYTRHSETHAPGEEEFESPLLGKTFRLKTYPLHDGTGNYIGRVNVWQNITSEKRLRAQLIQSEKMAATGRLAASIAHEINNPLQAIRGCVELALATNDMEKNKRYLGMAGTELDRLTTIVRRMIDFYRPARAERTSVDVRALIEDLLLLSAKRIQHARVTVHTDWVNNLPALSGVVDQLKQVFLNLILNAVDAMPQGGLLEIRGQMIHDQGNWITISIADQGQGIPPQDLDKIFEPFFTTKLDGTGLGLAICQNIITQHGGRITVDSTPGQGSTFIVWLPVQG